MEEERYAAGVNQYSLAWLWKLRRWRRCDWAIVSVSCIIVIAVMYLHFTSPPPAISVANYERITVGMREREVERIIGARTGGYGLFVNEGERLGQECGAAERWSWWANGYGILEVGYDAVGCVCCKRLEYHPGVIPAQPNLWPW